MRKSPIDVDKLIRLYAECWTIANLAKFFKAGTRTIKRHLRKRGVVIRTHVQARQLGPYAEPSTLKHDASEVAACYKAGATQTEMCSIFKMHGTTMRRILERQGVKIRTAGEGKRAQQQRLPVEVRKERAKKMIEGLRAWYAAGGKRSPKGTRKSHGTGRKN